MTELPWLSAVIFLPLLGAATLWFVPASAARWLTLGCTLLVFIIARVLAGDEAARPRPTDARRRAAGPGSGHRLHRRRRRDARDPAARAFGPGPHLPDAHPLR
jgi:hypothetical protein